MRKLKIILLCIACITVFAACAGDGSAGAEDNNAGENQENPVEAAAEEADPDAPDLPQVDMGGKQFTFLTSGWGSGSLSGDIAGEEYTGDPIDDAAYERRVKIEQTYNCQIGMVSEPDPAEAVNRYRTSVMAADEAYDAAITTCTNFSTLLTGGYLIDFKDVPNVDMDRPYWNKNFYDAMSIMGANFAADGDISKRRLECVWIMAFNKDIIKDNGFDSPFDLVKSGEWTYDKMHDMARQVARDLNGDGVMTREDDLWGINYTGDTIMGIINGSGVKIAVTDSGGIPQFTVDEESNLVKLMRIYDEMRDNSYSIDTLFMSGGGVTGLGDIEIFAENRCLFLACASHNVSVRAEEGASNTRGLRDLDVDFGIIPYPKWDTAQADYLPHTAGNYHPVLTIPKTNSDLENTGIMLEMMAYEGRKNITPAFYESLLKTKTARDEESVEMIDYIFGNISYDVGNMFNFGGIVGVFGYTMSTELGRSVVSTIERSIPVWQRDIDKIIDEIG